MSGIEALPPQTAVEAAIARVLTAERDARDAVARATGEADALNEKARADARALADRTERRIRSVRAAYEQRVAAEVAAIEAQAATQDAAQALSADDHRHLASALEALAAELTGCEG